MWSFVSVVSSVPAECLKKWDLKCCVCVCARALYSPKEFDLLSVPPHFWTRSYLYGNGEVVWTPWRQVGVVKWHPAFVQCECFRGSLICRTAWCWNPGDQSVNVYTAFLTVHRQLYCVVYIDWLHEVWTVSKLGTHHRWKICLLVATCAFLKSGVCQHWLVPCTETPRIPEVQNLRIFLHPKHHRTLCVGCNDVLIGFCWSSMWTENDTSIFFSLPVAYFNRAILFLTARLFLECVNDLF